MNELTGGKMQVVSHCTMTSKIGGKNAIIWLYTLLVYSIRTNF